MTYAWLSNYSGNFSFDPTADITFTQPGVFSVKLSVADQISQVGVAFVEITVLAPNTPPSAQPTGDPTSGTASLTVHFTANASDPDVGDVLSYEWDFRDPVSTDDTSTEENPAHVYEQPGDYLATLTVTDLAGAKATASVMITVDPVMEISVRAAQIKLAHKDKVTLWTDIWADPALLPDNGAPAEDAVIALYVDDIEVFAEPFSEFRPAFWDGENARVLIKRNLLVRYNLAPSACWYRARSSTAVAWTTAAEWMWSCGSARAWRSRSSTCARNTISSTTAATTTRKPQRTHRPQRNAGADDSSADPTPEETGTVKLI